MIEMLARNWGMVALRGLLALTFGLLTLFRPAVSLAVLVIFFGAFALVDGIFTVVSAIANRHGQPRWGVLVFAGLAGIAVGLMTLFWPGVTALALLYLIAAWALVHGVAEIVAAVRLRKVITHEWLLGTAGALAIVFGFLLVAFPGAGALAMVLWIGAYAAVAGILLLALGFKLRRWGREHPAPAPAPAH